MWLLENNGFLAAYQDTVICVEMQCAGEYQAFQVPAFSFQITDGVTVGYFDDVLFDDGTGIQILGYIMAGGTNYLYTSLVRLFIRVAADKCR